MTPIHVDAIATRKPSWFRGGVDRWEREAGAEAVEFALVSMLLLVLIVGMVNIAHLCQVQILVTQAAREGARLASVNKFDAAAVRSRVGLNVTLTGPAVSTDASGRCVRVDAAYGVPVTLPAVTGLHVTVRPQTINLTSHAIMRAEF